jgi:hypothetical protein
MSIRFRNYIFEGPMSFASWSPPYRAGLYAVVVPNQLWTPLPFEPIYFGESGNMSERGFLRSHHCYGRWMIKAGSETNLYVALYLMSGSTAEQRRAIESVLIRHYKPSCNFMPVLAYLIK